jgi:two-component system, NtrC family, response regulator AtoC
MSRLLMSHSQDHRLIEYAPDRALVFSNNPSVSGALREILQRDRWRVEACHRLDEFQRLTEEQVWPFVLIAQPVGSGATEELLRALRQPLEDGRTQAVVLAARLSADEAMRSIELGAADYLLWPAPPSQVLAQAERARRLACSAGIEAMAIASGLETAPPRGGTQRSAHSLIGESHAMVELSKRLVKVARRQDVSILITGETGAGKEVIARQLHWKSGRPGPFCAVNCATLVENLMESELFGHERGAFTGAHAVKKGLWEEAAEGTLFLDEITEAPLAVQSKLLRVMQEGVIRRVGSTREIKVTARVIAASNRDLKKAVDEGVFREDLFYRFKQVLRVPALRERVEDIPLLVEYFCKCEGSGMTVTPEAMELLCRYDWPGNVRELERLIGELAINFGPHIYPEDLLHHLQVPEHRLERSLDMFTQSVMNAVGDEWPTMNRIRNSIVVQAYLHFGQEFQVAKVLGMDYRTVGAILREELGRSADRKEVSANHETPARAVIHTTKPLLPREMI